MASSADPAQDEKARRVRSLLSSYYGSAPPSATNGAPPPPPIDTPDFDCDAYVERLVRETPLDALQTRCAEMAGEIRSLDSDMQMLVYENYSKFIVATDTIRRMKSNVEGMEAKMEELRVTVASTAERSEAVNASIGRAPRPGGATQRRPRTHIQAPGCLRTPAQNAHVSRPRRGGVGGALLRRRRAPFAQIRRRGRVRGGEARSGRRRRRRGGYVTTRARGRRRRREATKRHTRGVKSEGVRRGGERPSRGGERSGGGERPGGGDLGLVPRGDVRLVRSLGVGVRRASGASGHSSRGASRRIFILAAAPTGGVRGGG